ncbi:beta-galactoside alpha-2,6-sialyltransferase 2b [Lampris incognitus]|uniref:beta-galactoside alpha-2,6-sialyltransferase 2b n=1 Tax=Lampris incognitus TaxID=2546036 RepID=UPI0024B55BBA|nr:beta-galactoside alpha-2,6-sialyltransferase 2b [Lampris incognitus]
MKQWSKLLLVAMLAWLVLFLSLLSHFLGLPSTASPRARSVVSGPSLTRTEIRRLASIQAGQNVVKAVPGSSFASRNKESGWEERRAAAPGLTSEEPFNMDGQKVARVGGPDDGGGRSLVEVREDAVGSPEEDWEERRRRRKMKIRRRRGRRWRAEQRAQKVEEEEDEDDDYISRSKAVVQRLWRGNASSGMLSPRLQKALKDYVSSNKHRVVYRGQRRGQRSGQEVQCELKRLALPRTLDGSEEPFASLGWAKLVPSRPLNQLPEFTSCAVVTSAGAILNSSLGEEIDSHDAVLRFNAAPTKGFEKDVGRKTTIRIINSQILARPKHQFNTSGLYRDVTLVAWDPAPYSVDLSKWYKNPDYDLFTPYSERRRRRPDQPFYILHPGFIWRLWDVIQANTQENIQPNPPSSGFIGILLMMALCHEVHVYEYIPSVRQTDLCHYHEHYYDAACTLGAYHPLLYEKLLVWRMNTAPDEDLRHKGKVTLRGFSSMDCGQ